MRHLWMTALLAVGLLAACNTTYDVQLAQAHNAACASIEAGVAAAVKREASLDDAQWARVVFARDVMVAECTSEGAPGDLRESLERLRGTEGDLP